jgi:hypothetical protein
VPLSGGFPTGKAPVLSVSESRYPVGLILRA